MEGATAMIVRTFYGQSIAEVEEMEHVRLTRMLDLSSDRGLELAARILSAQIRAIDYLAEQVDELRKELREAKRTV